MQPLPISKRDKLERRRGGALEQGMWRLDMHILGDMHVTCHMYNKLR